MSMLKYICKDIQNFFEYFFKIPNNGIYFLSVNILCWFDDIITNPLIFYESKDTVCLFINKSSKLLLSFKSYSASLFFNNIIFLFVFVFFLYFIWGKLSYLNLF